MPPKREGNQVLWAGEMERPGGETNSVYFNFTCPDPAAFVPRLRPFLLAFLVPAMRVGYPLQLEQPIDQTTLDNLMEWQATMACWLPGKLRVVPIRCPIEPEPPKVIAQPRALTAFSGGVDSCYTAYCHTVAEHTGEYRRTQLGAGLMVHGFDIPEQQAAVFDSAFQRSKQILDSLGIEAFQMRTNLKSLTTVFECDWGCETHGIWLAATLACLEPFFAKVLIPSSYPFTALRLPWGSNPITDALFASGATPVWHDGAAHHRLAKVSAMAQHAGIQQGLRVCWQGSQLDRNCDRCFKCLATLACYRLNGVHQPECYENPCQIQNIARLALRTPSNRALFRVLHTEARRQRDNELVRALGKALRRHARQKLRRKLKQLCLNPQTFFDQI